MSDHDSTLNSVVVPLVSTRGVLDSDDASYLQQLYQRLKPQSGPVAINSIYVRYSSVTIKGPEFASGKSKSRSNSGSPSFVAMAEGGWFSLRSLAYTIFGHVASQCQISSSENYSLHQSDILHRWWKWRSPLGGCSGVVSATSVKECNRQASPSVAEQSVRVWWQYFLCASEVFEQPLCALHDKAREWICAGSSTFSRFAILTSVTCIYTSKLCLYFFGNLTSTCFR